MKRLTQKEIIKRFKKVHGNKYDYKNVIYKNNFTKVLINCKKHGDFFQTPYHHWTGKNCPTCAGTAKTTQKSFIEKAKKIHGNKYDYSFFTNPIINNRTKIKIFCSKHGFFEQSIINHLQGKGCKVCATQRKIKKRTKTNIDFTIQARQVHGDKYDYSSVKYIKCNKKVKIFCFKHNGFFEQKPEIHLNGHGCSICGGTKKLETEDFVEKAKTIHGNKYKYPDKYINAKTKIQIHCLKNNHGTFKQLPSNHLSGQGCPMCFGNPSEGQKEVFNFIKFNIDSNVLFETKIKLKTGKQNKVDIFIPDKNIIIEYYGDYWHCNPRFYKENYFNKKLKMTAGKIKIRDKKRIEKLQDLGYNILIIWEYDWKNNKTNIKNTIKDFCNKK